MNNATENGPRLTRRELLGATAAVSLGSASGCIDRIRNITSRQSPTAISLTVTAPPADADRMATLIARHLVENFEAVGIDATLDILEETELYREVFLNRNFELFVAQMPPMDDPNALSSLVHSVFAGEPGWQNPYSFTDISVDDHLLTQRRYSGEQRREAVGALLERLNRDQPFTTIGFPDQIRAVRTDRFVGWEEFTLREPLSYLGLERAPDISADEELTLTLSMIDRRISENLNPLAIEFRQPKPFTSLLYDPLARRIDDQLVPWLAKEWDWQPKQDSHAGGNFVLSLRPDLSWHDGTELTVDDIEFTFKFLADTSMGNLTHTVPAPRFRSLSTLVEDINVIDSETIRITVDGASEEVASRLLTVPMFPEHIWQDRTGGAELQGLEESENVTEALVSSNEDAVGSGPLVVEDISPDDEVLFRTFDDHFLWDRSPPEIPELFRDSPPFDELRLRIVPSNETAIELVTQEQIDGTAMSVDPRPQIIERVATESSLSKLVEQSTSPYQVGYNTGIMPFSNPHFRRLLGRLIDKRHITEQIFEGYGTPASNPFDGTVWSPKQLRFGQEDPEIPFLGSDGEVDVGAARNVFRNNGFEFDEDGRLILR